MGHEVFASQTTAYEAAIVINKMTTDQNLYLVYPKLWPLQVHLASMGAVVISEKISRLLSEILHSVQLLNRLSLSPQYKPQSTDELRIPLLKKISQEVSVINEELGLAADPSRLAYLSYSEGKPLGSNEAVKRQRSLISCVRSFRKSNQKLPLYLFLYDNGVPVQIIRFLEELGVCIVHLGKFRDWCNVLYPGSAPFIAEYPVIHKWFSLSAISKAHQVCCTSTSCLKDILYLDFDTLCLQDIENLFWFGGEGIVARETSNARRGEKYRYMGGQVLDPIWPEQEFKQQGLDLGCPLPPTIMNSGVVLMTSHCWMKLIPLLPTFLRLILQWSLFCVIHLRAWIQLVSDKSLNYTTENAHMLRSLLLQAPPKSCLMHKGYVPTAELYFPCRNPWIREEMAASLMFALVGIHQTDFPKEVVIQGCEETQPWGRPPTQEAVITHYFNSDNPQHFWEVVFPTFYNHLLDVLLPLDGPDPILKPSRGWLYGGVGGASLPNFAMPSITARGNYLLRQRPVKRVSVPCCPSVKRESNSSVPKRTQRMSILCSPSVISEQNGTGDPVRSLGRNHTLELGIRYHSTGHSSSNYGSGANYVGHKRVSDRYKASHKKGGQWNSDENVGIF
eukprot:Platyproteum_vivax@DN6753_c0_g1_i1.p1